MCEACEKSLRIAALDYFKCLYDFYGTFGIRNEVDAEELDEDALMSEATYNDIIKMHEGAATWELLQMIAEKEKVKWQNKNRKMLRETAFRWLDKVDCSEEEKEKHKKEIEEMLYEIS